MNEKNTNPFTITPNVLKTVTPRVLRSNNHKQIRADLDEYGYVAVRVMDDIEAASVLHEFETWIQNIDPRINLQEPIIELFPDNVLGIIKSYGIGQAEFMWKIRNNKRIKMLFSKLWDCNDEDLIVSFDGACYAPCFANSVKNKFNLWPHRDQHPDKNNCETFQGSLNLVDNNGANDGGFVVWPKTHTIDNWTHYNGMGRNFYEIKTPINGININNARRVVVPPGTFILWDSRTIHCNVPPLNCNQQNNKRVAIYVCMANLNNAPNTEFIKMRQFCMKHGKTTSHHPFDFTINKDAIIYTKSVLNP